MMKRIGSLGLGKLAVLGTLASVLFILVGFGQGMFSPGALSVESRKESSLGGVSSHAAITNCSACHAPAWSSKTMAARCMDCHENVRAQIDGEKPMHGLLAAGQACRNCHTEHRGPHAALTSFGQFDHACTGFKLIGKHQQVECSSCHREKTYQGTSQACVSCHAEPAVHKGKFGTDCRSCHTPNTWESATLTANGVNGGKFNHDVTGFALRDKHATLDCKSCHVKESFKGLSQSCVSCHKEPEVHLGKFGVDCKQCHGTHNWKSVTLKPETLLAVKFDHDTTGFKLMGAHKSVDCKSCHVNNTFKGTSQSCVSCHAEPVSHKPHPKTFGNDCSKCHSTVAWKGATLTKHTFPMNHRTRNRQNSACAVCHPATVEVVSATGVAMKSPSYATYTCYNCHHTPEREARRHDRRRVANLNDCAKCHATGRKGRERAALDGAVDTEFCQACPESRMGGMPLTEFFPTSCPATAEECKAGCTDLATILRSLPPSSVLQSAKPQTDRDIPRKVTPTGEFLYDSALERLFRPAFTTEFAVLERSHRTTRRSP
jgi:hypothetical protein